MVSSPGKPPEDFVAERRGVEGQSSQTGRQGQRRARAEQVGGPRSLRGSLDEHGYSSFLRGALGRDLQTQPDAPASTLNVEMRE